MINCEINFGFSAFFWINFGKEFKRFCGNFQNFKNLLLSDLFCFMLVRLSSEVPTMFSRYLPLENMSVYG